MIDSTEELPELQEESRDEPDVPQTHQNEAEMKTDSPYLADGLIMIGKAGSNFEFMMHSYVPSSLLIDKPWHGRKVNHGVPYVGNVPTVCWSGNPSLMSLLIHAMDFSLESFPSDEINIFKKYKMRKIYALSVLGCYTVNPAIRVSGAPRFFVPMYVKGAIRDEDLVEGSVTSGREVRFNMIKNSSLHRLFEICSSRPTLDTSMAKLTTKIYDSMTGEQEPSNLCMSVVDNAFTEVNPYPGVEIIVSGIDVINIAQITRYNDRYAPTRAVVKSQLPIGLPIAEAYIPSIPGIEYGYTFVPFMLENRPVLNQDGVQYGGIPVIPPERSFMYWPKYIISQHDPISPASKLMFDWLKTFSRSLWDVVLPSMMRSSSNIYNTLASLHVKTGRGFSLSMANVKDLLDSTAPLGFIDLMMEVCLFGYGTTLLWDVPSAWEENGEAFCMWLVVRSVLKSRCFIYGEQYDIACQEYFRRMAQAARVNLDRVLDLIDRILDDGVDDIMKDDGVIPGISGLKFTQGQMSNLDAPNVLGNTRLGLLFRLAPEMNGRNRVNSFETFKFLASAGSVGIMHVLTDVFKLMLSVKDHPGARPINLGEHYDTLGNTFVPSPRPVTMASFFSTIMHAKMPEMNEKIGVTSKMEAIINKTSHLRVYFNNVRRDMEMNGVLTKLYLSLMTYYRTSMVLMSIRHGDGVSSYYANTISSTGISSYVHDSVALRFGIYMASYYMKASASVLSLIDYFRNNSLLRAHIQSLQFGDINITYREATDYVTRFFHTQRIDIDPRSSESISGLLNLYFPFGECDSVCLVHPIHLSLVDLPWANADQTTLRMLSFSEEDLNMIIPDLNEYANFSLLKGQSIDAKLSLLMPTPNDVLVVSGTTPIEVHCFKVDSSNTVEIASTIASTLITNISSLGIGSIKSSGFKHFDLPRCPLILIDCPVESTDVFLDNLKSILGRTYIATPRVVEGLEDNLLAPFVNSREFPSFPEVMEEGDPLGDLGLYRVSKFSNSNYYQLSPVDYPLSSQGNFSVDAEGKVKLFKPGDSIHVSSFAPNYITTHISCVESKSYVTDKGRLDYDIKLKVAK